MDSLRDNGMEKAPQSPYSRKLAPLDIHRFGYITGCLAGGSCADATEFLEAIRLISNIIEIAIFQAVFLD
jgi:hypothetical protein